MKTIAKKTYVCPAAKYRTIDGPTLLAGSFEVIDEEKDPGEIQSKETLWKYMDEPNPSSSWE